MDKKSTNREPPNEDADIDNSSKRNHIRENSMTERAYAFK